MAAMVAARRAALVAATASDLGPPTTVLTTSVCVPGVVKTYNDQV
jgi:hypothetical protein